MSTIISQPLITLHDALIVRRLRNICCEYLTNYQQKLGFWEQVGWYYRKYKKESHSGSYRIFIFQDLRGHPIGYGALQRHGRRLYITECLETSARGQGYGTQILNSLIRIGVNERCDLVAEVWATNQASRALHEKAGFMLTSHREHKGQELLVYQFEIKTKC